MKKCLVIGGNGFIASHLVEALILKGYEVRVFDNFEHNIDNLRDCFQSVELFKGSFLNQNDVSAAMKGIDILFHYASLTTPITAVLNPVYDVETNILGSVRLLQSAIINEVEHIVFPSSGGTIYGDKCFDSFSEEDKLVPFNPYAIYKLTIERYLDYYKRRYGIKCKVLRYSNPYGERQNPYSKQGVIPVFLNKILHNESPVIFGDGSAIRDFIYIKDAVEATMAVFENDTEETTFNIGSGKGTSLLELIELMKKITGLEIKPKYKLDDSTYVPRVVLDITKITKCTDWMPKTGLEEGIKKTWEWLQRIDSSQ